MYDKMSDNVAQTMRNANSIAHDLNHEYIGTEHVLLGMIQIEQCGAMRFLNSRRLDCRTIRREVEKLIQGNPDTVLEKPIPQTPRAKKVIEYSMDAAREHQCDKIHSMHLLCGLMREEEGVAAQVLRNLGVSMEMIQEGLQNPGAPTRTETRIGEEVIVQKLDHGMIVVQLAPGHENAQGALLAAVQRLGEKNWFSSIILVGEPAKQ